MKTFSYSKSGKWKPCSYMKRGGGFLCQKPVWQAVFSPTWNKNKTAPPIPIAIKTEKIKIQKQPKKAVNRRKSKKVGDRLQSATYKGQEWSG